MDPMLEVDHIGRKFGQLVAVRDVSFNVREGEIRGLIGPNGSGKTTTFNMISGFLAPTSGKVRLGGEVISGKTPHAVAARGLVRTFQLTSLYRDMSVLENVEIGHHLRRGSRTNPVADVRESALEILDFLGLSEARDMPARMLPAGTQRTLSIATALAAAPKLLLLDEPLAGLNPSEKAGIVAKMRLLRERGVTVLLVEHDVKSVLSVCDRVVVINFGERIFDGAAGDVSKDPQVIKAYLGSSGKHDA
ncbi:MAG: ABC transporter ATP-binding protein [Alphaproteobacteria bacterium]|nr:ABC transporter ATP-binding protein [Alphaproteobacteria bacterium]